MGAWVLIVASFGAMHVTGATHSGSGRSVAVAMQEFANLPACQHASIEAQKIAPGIRVVCVPKG